MSSTNFNSLSLYTSLLTSEYQTSPKEIAWLTANLQLFQDVMSCLLNLPADFDLDQAVGAQLDTLGLYIGASRTVGFQPSDSVSPILDDGTYRILLQATVLKNHWNGKLVQLRSIWQALFPSGILLYTDNQDMSVSFYIAAPLTSILQDLIVQGYILPRPQGVGYVINLATLPMLGFDQQTAFISGWANLVVSTTADVVISTNTITVASNTGIANGQGIYGPGIAVAATVTNVSGTTITMSLNAISNQTGADVGFYDSATSGHFI